MDPHPKFLSSGWRQNDRILAPTRDSLKLQHSARLSIHYCPVSLNVLKILHECILPSDGLESSEGDGLYILYLWSQGLLHFKIKKIRKLVRNDSLLKPHLQILLRKNEVFIPRMSISQQCGP